MIETVVIQTIIVCVTLIILVSMYQTNSAYAVKQWKGRFLTLQREIKKYERQVNDKFSDMQKKSILSSLKIPEELGDEILDFLEQYGIPEEAVMALVGNKKLLEGLSGKLSNLKDASSTSDGI